MKVLLLANYLPDGQESMQRFAEVLAAALPRAGCEVRMTRPEPLLGRLKKGNTGAAKWLGYFDKFVWFPLQLKKAAQWADIVHVIDHSSASYTTYLQTKPHLVTCHDLLAIRSALGEIPENPTRWFGQQLQRLILRGLNRAQRLVCVSEKTKADLLRISRITPASSSVIYMGLNYPYQPMASEASSHVLQTLGINSPYLMHVGLNAWYKNRLGVLRIYQRLLEQHPSAPRLVMAGAAFTQEMADFIQIHGLKDNVSEVLSCSNEELRGLYSRAELLLFPSLEEGFGWPIIEAQACACRVVTTGKAPMTEVGGDSVIYINPKEVEEAVRKLHETLSEDSESRHVRINRGLENAARFSTDCMIREYLQCYQLAIEEHRSSKGSPSTSRTAPSFVN